MDPDIAELLERARSAVLSTVAEKRIGVAFSGGVDSSLLAKLCRDLGYDVTLLTIGFPGSHDLLFAGEINGILRYPHETLEIDDDSFRRVFPRVRELVGTDDLSWNENSIAFHYVSVLAGRLGLGTVVTANGIDELFCGYNAYRDAFAGGPGRIMDMMDEKLDNELRMMEAVNRVASESGVSILQPLLSPGFIGFARALPLEEKITGPDDLVRKHMIRRLAAQCGVPEAACSKRKKAMQYGSQIHKSLMRAR